MSAQPFEPAQILPTTIWNYFCNNNTKRKVKVTILNFANIDKLWKDTNHNSLQYLAFPVPSEWATLSILTRPTPTELWWVLLQNLVTLSLSQICLSRSPSLKMSTESKKFLATNIMMKSNARTPHLAHLEAVGNLCWKNGLIRKVNCECEQKLWQLVVA